MISGIINIYKEAGFTSHDVVACLRKIIGQKKIGHTGTLDPDAVGVLPVCLGKATKLCSLLTEKEKTYEAVLLLGKETDTQDLSGTVLEMRDTSALEEDQVRECISQFLGEYEQVPPMYSALKINGRKLCDLAREGKTVERKGRKIWIHEIQVLSMELPRVTIRVRCSKGTYIRTLCHDIGKKLGTGGCMEHLIRTGSGAFGIQDSVTLEQVEQCVRENRLGEILMPIDEMFPDARRLVLDESSSRLACNGGKLPVREAWNVASGEQFRVYDQEKRFLALYRLNEDESCLELVKMFFDPTA